MKINSQLKIISISLLFTILLFSNFGFVNGSNLSAIFNDASFISLGKSIASSLVSSEPGSLDRANNIACVGQSHFSDKMKGHIIIYTFDEIELNIEYDLLFQVSEMNTVACDVAKGDVDGDNFVEIVVTGYSWDNDNIISWLQIYDWDNKTLTLVDSVDWHGQLDDSFFGISLSVKIKDLNFDGVLEIVTCGSTGVEGKVYSELVVWDFDTKLSKKDSVNWSHCEGDWSVADDVAIGFLNEEIVIVTGGQCNDATGKALADLNSWSFTNQITHNGYQTWESLGDTAVLGIFAKNNMVFTAGLSNNGILDQGQITKWNLVDLSFENSVEWSTDGNTLANDLCIADVDNDNVIEVVTGGWVNETTTVLSQLRVWSLDLNLIDTEEWYVNDHSGIYGVHLENVDDDNVLEILTAGFVDNYSTKEVTIWEYQESNEPHRGIRHVDSDHVLTTNPQFPMETIILVLIAVFVVGLLIVIVLYKRKT